MRVAVDLTFYTGTRGGMETYARDLYRGLAAKHPQSEFVAIATPDGAKEISTWFPGSTRPTRFGGASATGWAVAEVGEVAWAARRLDADVLHCPANLAPLRASTPIVLTLHDVNPFAIAEQASVSGAMTRWLMKRAFLTAQAVITDSHWSAGEIRRWLPDSDTSIEVIPPVGIREERIAPDEFASTAARWGLSSAAWTRPFILAGGNRLPHKNWEGLMRALAHIPRQERPRLMVTGSGGPQDPLVPLVAELGLTEDVLLTGWTSPSELSWLYANASAYVLPSVYEGFGLGVLEAMTRGCPVLASDIPVLREVGGDAVMYTDSTDPAALASSIRAITADGEGRDAMRRRGLGRAQLFQGESSVDRVWEVLTSVAHR